MRHRHSQPRPFRALGWKEWLLLTLAVLAVVGALEQLNVLQRTNRLLQDMLLRHHPREVASSPVVIVGIDDKSIAALGRWPWPRAVHAQAIDRISAGQPAAIGLDLLLTEPDLAQPHNDQALAAALARSGKVVLPVMMQSQGGEAVKVQPLAPFARAAAALGHVHLPVDDDGLARSVYLWEGHARALVPHFSLATAQVATRGGSAPALPPPAPTDTLNDVHRTQDPVSRRWLDWQRHQLMQVPYAGPPGSFTRHSLIDVLDGTVAPEVFRSKQVFIGATAAGVGDLYATPVTSERALMSGVEIAANVAHALHTQHQLHRAPAWLNLFFVALPPLLALASLAFISPLAGLLLCLGLMAAMGGITVAGAWWWRVQLGPVAGWLGLALAYTLWSWRRMDAATRYLVAEYQQLRSSGLTLALPPTQHRHGAGDFLDRRIEALTGVTQQLRDLHRFVSDSINSLPDATLVCDLDHRVLLANAAAARHFQQPLAEALVGQHLATLGADLVNRSSDTSEALPDRLRRGPGASGSVEVRDGQGRDLLVKWAPSFSANGTLTGWILSFVDVTQLHIEQRERDDAMHFLSHDMRAPQSAILTLLDLVRQDPEAMPQAQFHDRIERHARKALALADGFINLVRAQSREYHMERRDLCDLLGEVLDDAWEKSQSRRIRLKYKLPEGAAECLMDRELVSRAMANLVGNALKYSPEDTEVWCTITAEGLCWEVAIQDQGPGIDAESQEHLFRPFYRVQQHSRTEGTGLGLPFVKTVAIRHGGEVRLRSAPGQGSRFALLLPQAPALDASALPDDLPALSPATDPVPLADQPGHTDMPARPDRPHRSGAAADNAWA